MVIYDHNSKILKHVVRKCHINSTYPSTAHMLSCVQLDILQSGVQQHENFVWYMIKEKRILQYVTFDTDVSINHKVNVW